MTEIHHASAESRDTVLDATKAVVIRNEREQVLDPVEPKRHPMRQPRKLAGRVVRLIPTIRLLSPCANSSELLPYGFTKFFSTEASMCASSMPATSRTFAPGSRVDRELARLLAVTDQRLEPGRLLQSFRIRGFGSVVAMPRTTMAQQCASDVTLITRNSESGYRHAIPDSAPCHARRR
jgi:hypothetical protein